MAKHKTTSATKHAMIDTQTEDLFVKPNTSGKFKRYKWAAILLLVGLILLVVASRGIPVVAIVNGRPIFRLQLTKVLEDRFGKQTLEGMISEELVLAEAQNAQVAVTQAEKDAQIAQITNNLGGNVGIDDLLRFQGMTREDFERQLELQLVVEKMLAKDFVISEADIDGFIATSSALLTATEPAQLRVEARQAIVSQKVNEKLQPWFEELKAKAKIWRLF